MREYTVHEETTANGYRLEIHPDTDGESPRHWSVAGVVVDWSRSYDIGDRKPTDEEKTALRYGGWEGLKRHLARQLGARVVLPISMLDHSGITIWIGAGPHWSDSAGWDSGAVGFTYDTPEFVRECFGDGASDAEIEATLRVDVETLDQFLRGDVYGYTLVNPANGETVESVWGFYGLDECLEEARVIAAGLPGLADKETLERVLEEAMS